MELLLIRSPYNGFTINNEEGTLYFIFDTLTSLKKQILSEREEIDKILHEIIPRVSFNKQRRVLLEMKRNVFNKLDPFDSKVLLEFVTDEHEKKFILSHNSARENYKLTYESFITQVKTDKYNLEQEIQLKLCDDWFQAALLTANFGLYSSVCGLENSKLDKNKYISLLRYLYKSSMMCTPSSLWSGISTAVWGERNLAELEDFPTFVFEYNTNKAKHKERAFVRKNFFKLDFLNDTFYLNPTVIVKNDFVYYWRFEEAEMVKCKIKCNSVLLYILSNYRLAAFKLSDIVNDVSNQYNIENFDVVKLCDQLIQLDFLRMNNDPRYGTSNPLKYTKYSSMNKKTHDLIDKKHLGVDSTFQEKYKILIEGEDTNSIRVSTKLPWKNVIISKKVEHDLKNAMKVYKYLHSAFYKNNKRKVLTDYFLEKFEADVLVSLVTVTDTLNFGELADYKSKNYRSWETGQINNNYREFIELIRSKNLGNKEIKISLDELIEKIPFSLEIYNDVPSEVIFQFYEKEDSNYIIPEMLSTQYGRFAGRFIKIFEENVQNKINQQIYDSIESQESTYQVNLHLNNELDGIGFDIPNIKNKIYLYDFNFDESKTHLSINQIFLKLDSNTGRFSFHKENGDEIKLWLASTISPGSDRLYRLINNISQHDMLNINGHAKNRLELDLDYQPRITVENIVISRERFRLEKSKFDFLFSYINEYLKMEKMLSIIRKNKLPKKFFTYTDRDYKPQYIEVNTIYDLYIFQRIIKSSVKYIYIEEVLPDQNAFWLKDKSYSYNAEVWTKL